MRVSTDGTMVHLPLRKTGCVHGMVTKGRNERACTRAKGLQTHGAPGANGV